MKRLPYSFFILLMFVLLTAAAGCGSRTTVSEVDGMTMVYVPKGDFQMGIDQNDRKWIVPEDRQPAHTVYLDAFWIDETEVTTAMYAQCVEAGECTQPRRKSSKSQDSYYGNPDFANHPMIHVDWAQASVYCAWAGRRLPTEAEWEKAAHGEKEQRYPWGEEYDCLNANVYQKGKCPDDETDAVGSYPDGASPYGALDMAGNVEEWTADWYAEDTYSASPRENPTGPESGTHRAVRGGRFAYGSNNDTTHREARAPDHTSMVLGFRCATSKSP